MSLDSTINKRKLTENKTPLKRGCPDLAIDGSMIDGDMGGGTTIGRWCGYVPKSSFLQARQSALPSLPSQCAAHVPPIFNLLEPAECQGPRGDTHMLGPGIRVSF